MGDSHVAELGPRGVQCLVDGLDIGTTIVHHAQHYVGQESCRQASLQSYDLYFTQSGTPQLLKHAVLMWTAPPWQQVTVHPIA